MYDLDFDRITFEIIKVERIDFKILDFERIDLCLGLMLKKWVCNE